MAEATSFERSRAVLIAVAFLAPFSATHLAGPFTVGRTAALALGVVLAADLLVVRPARPHLDLPAMLLVVGYVGLSAWIFLSAATSGCNCNGKAGGFFEFAVIGVLALVAIGFEPKLRTPTMIATLAGLVLAALLALLGVGSLNSGTVDLTQTGGRLSGSFGNANELGFAVALAIPIAFAYRSAVKLRDEWVIYTASVLALLAALVLTYSRGAIIAAGAGVLVVALWEAKGSRRRVLAICGAAAACVLLGVAVYSLFQREREQASFKPVSSSLGQLDLRDLSGWDSRAAGPIPEGPSKLRNAASGIQVETGQQGEGASFRWGEAPAGGAYTLRFSAMAQRNGLPLAYALGDSSNPEGRVTKRAQVGREWQRFSLRWRPRQPSPHATVYVWQPAGPSSVFSIDRVDVLAAPPGSPVRLVPVPDRLEGSLYARLTSSASRQESRYTDSRIDAASLAWRAFRSKPLVGIGWGTFPFYSATHLEYGELAAHDEYLAIAAELGLVGAVLLAVMLAGMGIGVRRAGTSRTETAAIGVLSSALVGLVFVEALPVPQLSIPLALAAAVVCASRNDSTVRRSPSSKETNGS